MSKIKTHQIVEDKVKQTGATFTPEELANFLAEKILEYHCKDNLQILDPACGDGALLVAIAKKMRNHNLNFKVTGYDSNSDYLSIAKNNLQKNVGINYGDLFHKDFLEIIDLRVKNSLRSCRSNKNNIS